MHVSFSTINQAQARRYFEDPKWAYLNSAAKEVALKYVGEGVLRVQDPMMYPSPQLEITEQSVYDEIMAAAIKKDTPYGH